MIDFATKTFKERLKFIAKQIDLDIENSDEKDYPDNHARYTHIDQYILMLQNAANIVQNDEELDGKLVGALLGYMKNNSRKIDAIKEFRSLFGEGLKDSKDEIERVMNWSSMRWEVDVWSWKGKIIAKGLKST